MSNEQYVSDMIKERDFLADQVDKLESVIDEKQETVDRLHSENTQLYGIIGSRNQEIEQLKQDVVRIVRLMAMYSGE